MPNQWLNNSVTSLAAGLILGPVLGLSGLCSQAAAVEEFFPNVPRTAGEFLAGPLAPEQGRTAIVGWHGGRIVSVPERPGSQTGADVQVRDYDLRDLSDIVIRNYGHAGVGFHAHGHVHAGEVMYLGGGPGASHGWPNSINMTIDPATERFEHVRLSNATGLPFTGSGNRGGTPWNARMWWSYGEVSGDAWLRRYTTPGQSHDDATVATWDHLGLTGVIGMPFIVGNILIYASDQTGTGVATYDISDPSNPVLLDVLKEDNPGGYWPELYGHYVFFPRRRNEGGAGSQAGFMVVDYSDPTDLKLVANVNLPASNQYVQFQDEFAFMNCYKIDMRTYEVVLEFDTVDSADGRDVNGNTPGVGALDASQYAMPFGNLVALGGYGTDGPGLSIWAHQAEPDTRNPYVAYHVPADGQTGYSRVVPITVMIHETLRSETINADNVIVRPVGGDPIDCYRVLTHGGQLNITPVNDLAADTTYEVIFVDGGVLDAAGNGIDGYSFRFSTGSALTGGNQPPEISAFIADDSQVSPGTSVTLNVTASDPEGQTLSYRFDAGDGSTPSAWLSSPTFVHTYAGEGHFRASVQVRDSAGGLVSTNMVVSVVSLIAGERPTNSSPVVLDAAGRRVITVNPDGNSVAAVHADTHAVLWEQRVGTDPRSLALASDGTVWVTSYDSDEITVLDVISGAVRATLSLPYGTGPVGIAITPDGSTAYVAGQNDGSLRRFDIASLSQTGVLALGHTPRAIAITADGNRALVTRFISDHRQGSVYDVDLTDLTLTRTIRLQRGRIQDSSANGRGIPNYLAGITIDPQQEFAWVVGKKDNTERGALFNNTPAGHDTTVRAILVPISLSANDEPLDDGFPTMRMDIDNSDSPSSVAFSQHGDYGFITLQGNNQFVVVDMIEYRRNLSAQPLLTRRGTGSAPQGIVVDPSTNQIFVHEFLQRGLGIYAADSFFSTGSIALPRSAVATQATELLSTEVLAGKRVFYDASDVRMSAESYISCATCHFDGGHDGMVWDFTQRGEGLRNTIDLRGRGGMAMGHVHWSGNFDEIQDFENDIRSFFGGEGFLSDSDFAASEDPLGDPKGGRSDDLDALAAYVASLAGSSIPRAPGRADAAELSATALAGRAVFSTQNCASCHNPATHYVDRLRHDVGTMRTTSGQRLGATLDGIATPTLLGLHAGAPYLHDGAAETLAEVFSAAGGITYQLEDAVVSGGASIGPASWVANQQWHGSGNVRLDADGEAVTVQGVDAGAGGPGLLRIRYGNQYSGASLRITINGVDQGELELERLSSFNTPGFIASEMRHISMPVTFAAGSNSVTLTRDSGAITLDDMTVSTPADLAKAAPHRRVLDLPAEDQSALIDYLDSLDPVDAPRMRTITIRVRDSSMWTLFPVNGNRRDGMSETVWEGLPTDQDHVINAAATLPQ